MSSQHSYHSIFMALGLLLTFLGGSLGAAVVVGEKREMPSNPGYGGGSGSGSGGGGYTGYEGYAAPHVMPAQPSPHGQGYIQPSSPQYGPSPYTNPGFSVQTGFEGFLVPNSWYGLLPWGVEGIVVVIAGVIVFIVISVVILGLLAWLTGFGDYAIVKESARNLLPSQVNFEALTDITNTLLDALDKYDELQVAKAK